MRIAINTRLVIPSKMDGIGCFTYEAAWRIMAQHSDDQFFLFFDRPPSRSLTIPSNATAVVLPPPARHPILWYLFFEYSTRWALHQYKIDLFLSTDGMIPLHSKVPTVSVIHDLNFEHNTENLRSSQQRYMHHFFPCFAMRSTRVATVSQYSKKDICDTYDIADNKIDVVYDGASNHYRPLDEKQKKKVRETYTNGTPYIIFIGTILRRKNLAMLLRAFDRVKEQLQTPLKLVVVGRKVWWADELAQAYNDMTHKDDVIFVGHADTPSLAMLLASAEMLVYPSLFEGFGIPVLESMYAETPVVCSRTTSLPEVGGDAVRYIDPASFEDIADAIKEVLNPAKRQQMIEKGRLQRTKYSWDITANLLWESMMKAIEKV